MKTIQVGDIVGDYTVIGTAGSGGMGTVYKIEHLITKRIEAMKLLPPGVSGDPEQVRRFQREIQLQARLHHPNIVGLYNAVRDGDLIALVMEFVEGESLQHLLESGPLPVKRAVDIGSQVLGALAYAHDARVVHRDVSPANIIITPQGIAKLTDFGLAMGTSDLRLSTSGVPVGSPWYMSPEQVKGIQKLDARTDLYAMGAVMHEMLTGRKLFEADGAFAVMRAHVEAEPKSPSWLNPAVPEAFDAILKKALAKNPDERFQSAEEFRLALQQAPAIVHRAAGVNPQKGGAWRKVMVMAMAPAVLAAGIYGGLVLRAGHVGATEKQPPAAPVVKPVAQPAPPPLPELSVPAAEPTPAQPEVAETPDPPAQAPTVKAVAPVHRKVPPPQKTALRVNGAPPASTLAPLVISSQPAPAEATAKKIPAPATEAPPPESVVTNAVETPAAAAPAEAETAPSTPDALPANPQAGGNRLVRALGKVNPFRKRAKQDPAKTPIKQD